MRPGQIAVVFRRPQPLADLVSEVFQRLEIPFFLENGRSLGRWPAIVMLLRLLELDADDWPMYKLLGVLGNNYFAPDWADWNDRAAGLAERTIRSLQIPRGRQRLLEGAAPAVGNAIRGVPDARNSSPRSWNATEGVPYSRALEETPSVHDFCGAWPRPWTSFRGSTLWRPTPWLGRNWPITSASSAR